ncbi:aldehyde dehydrogenase (NADP(+)) [Tenacibaculum sp. SZ-18]|uniref:aldehyde dehydrogenase (NADP(+)) n=1 Tax=Tenacibaculum sp. SZ-18 TaxID=754423 RepID=UPI000C2D0B94|nr:aldehyde dehydrogenase (NADP(+)) [Tenacibaculum sp. SZ-18]AUC16142.1 aldehyde dehydrogenase (NADP(+)) [Tenacibaculum sp. SZ-18]
MITGKNYIGNQLSSEGDITFKTFNPELNVSIENNFSQATAEEIENAVAKATEAFDVYKHFSGAKKAIFLRAIADEIEALDEKLINVYCSETGLPAGRAAGERGRTIFQLRSFADLVEEGSWVEASIDTGIPDRTPAPKPDLRKMNIPLGPVVVFGASNFPLAYSTAGGDTAAALAAGCPVIVKSHPMHAGTGELIASAIIKAAEKTGMPNGVFSNINAKDYDSGQQLVSHPKVKAVGFTGSIKGGRALLDIAAKREEPIPVFAEMGSVNPVVVLPKALQNRGHEIAKTYAGSITLGTGQFCTNPGLILGIAGEELSSFIDELGSKTKEINPSCMLHPNIHEAYEKGKQQVVNQNDVTIVANLDGEVQTNYASHGVAMVSGKTFLENSNLHHEVFGPFSIVVACENLKELEEIVAGLEGQLTGTIISDDDEISNYSELVAKMQNRVGRLIFNGVPTGVEVCPSMVHGGPYPASTDSRFTAVGINSIKRWVRPFSFQNWPNSLLPDELKDENPLQITRVVNGEVNKS